MVIHALMAESGPIAAFGEAMTHAINAAIRVVNDHGGVLGQPVELVLHDTAGSPDQVAAVLQDLLAQGQPHAVIPGSLQEQPAGIPVLADAGVFTVHHWTDVQYNDAEDYPYAFGSAHSTESYVTSLVEELDGKGYETLGFLAADDQGGQAYRSVAEPAFADAGYETHFAFVPGDAVDATPQMQQVLDHDPDALILAGCCGALAGAMVTAHQTVGVDIPTYTAQTFTVNDLAAIAPAEAYEGWSLQNLASAVAGTELTEGDAFRTFYEALLEETGGEIPFAITVYLVAYNDVILATSAANLAGSLDPADMAAAIEGATQEDMPLYLAPADFSGGRRFAGFGPDDFVFTSFGPLENGLMVPLD